MSREDLLLTDEERRKAISNYGYNPNQCYGDDYYTQNDGEFQVIAQVQLDKVLKQTEEIFTVYDRYIKELEGECASMGVSAYVHGWRSDKVELGKKLRKGIKDLKEKWSKAIVPEKE